MNRLLLGLLLAAGMLFAAGCGPGEGGTGGAMPTPVGSVGRVDGFGSAIVEGERLDDRRAQVRVDENPAAPTAAPLTAIQLGTQIDALASGGVLQSGTVGAEVIGRIEFISTDETTITVAGQRVIIGGHPVINPVIDGFTSGDLFVDDAVEVHGVRLSGGDVLATRVQRRAQDDTVTRIAGTISNLDAANRRFNLSGRQVSYAAASVLPGGRALADGLRVTVFTDVAPPPVAAPLPAPLAAQVVRIEQPPIAEGAALLLAGPALEFAAPARFTLRGVPVDASNASFAAGQTAALLRNDAMVRVRGSVSGGVLRAQQVTVLQQPEDAPISITAPITDFSSGNAVFRMRGATVSVTPETQFIGGDGNNLGDGVTLALRGKVVGGVVVADRVELVDPPGVMVGAVSQWDAAAGTFSLPPLARRLSVSASTSFINGTRADLANTRRVRAQGIATASGFEAVSITFLDSAAQPATALLAGLIGDVNGQLFELNGRRIAFDSATRFTGGPTGTSADLASQEGVVAIVRARQSGNQLLASSVDFRPAIDAANSVFGYISDFVSINQFRVAGQLVNAGSATIAGAAASPVRDGVFVLVEGSVTNAVMQAARVEVLSQ